MRRSRKNKPGLLDKPPLKDPSLNHTINFGIQVKMVSLLRTASLTKEKTHGQLQKRSPR